MFLCAFTLDLRAKVLNLKEKNCKVQNIILKRKTKVIVK